VRPRLVEQPVEGLPRVDAGVVTVDGDGVPIAMRLAPPAAELGQGGAVRPGGIRPDRLVERRRGDRVIAGVLWPETGVATGTIRSERAREPCVHENAGDEAQRMASAGHAARG